ncbi:MAG: hypothetical protein ABI614_02005 [Planctomycetota bacterium]
MAKLKLDKESVQGFFFNHTEKIVLAVVLLLLGLFIWTGSSIEGIGSKNPAELARDVSAAETGIEAATWDNIKTEPEYNVSLNHLKDKERGDAPTSESYYRLEKPLNGPGPQSVTPRQDPQLFAPTDIEATVVIGSLAFKARSNWKDPFADLANMEQKKVEAPKKKKKKSSKKGAGGYMSGEGMDAMPGGMGAEEGGDESAYPGGMAGMYGGTEGMGVMGGGAAGPAVRADADKFPGYQPTVTSTPTGSSSVIGRYYPVVSVKALVPYQQQWDEFERVFADARDYVPSRDIPRYLSFRAERAEVPSDPSIPLKWELHTTTNHQLSMIPKFAFAGYPGEIADPKYLLQGVLTMPVPPVMMRDLRGLALHSKVPMEEEVKAKTVERATPAVTDIDDLRGAPDLEALPPPGARLPGAGGSGAGMYGGMPGPGGEGMYGGGMEMSGQGGGGMYGGGMGGGMGGQLVRGPQSEFLMVRFFDLFAQPGKQYVYRIQVWLEDPNHPQNPQSQPQDRYLSDTTRTRLAGVAAEEAKQTAAAKTPVRVYTVASEWSEPTAPVSISLNPEIYAGGVTLPRALEIMRTDPTGIQKTGYSIPADGEPTAEVMSLSWDSDYPVDLPGILTASRGTHFSKKIQANVIDPVTMTFKVIPDYHLTSGELVVDLRGGEILEAPAAGAQPLLTPGEVAVIDASGNFVVRNELDDWQTFGKYAPPPPIVIEGAPAANEGYEMMGPGMMGPGEIDNPYGK